MAPQERNAGAGCATRVPLLLGVGRVPYAVLVIHENRGLNDRIRNVAGRLAAGGYSALALDLLSEEGGTASFPGEAEVAAALSAAPPNAAHMSLAPGSACARWRRWTSRG